MEEAKRRYFVTILYHAMKQNRSRLHVGDDLVTTLRLRLASLYMDTDTMTASDALEELTVFEGWDSDLTFRLRDFYGVSLIEIHEHSPFEILLYAVCLGIAFSQQVYVSREVNPFCKLDCYVLFRRTMDFPSEENVDDALQIFNEFIKIWNDRLCEQEEDVDGTASSLSAVLHQSRL